MAELFKMTFQDDWQRLKTLPVSLRHGGSNQEHSWDPRATIRKPGSERIVEFSKQKKMTENETQRWTVKLQLLQNVPRL